MLWFCKGSGINFLKLTAVSVWNGLNSDDRSTWKKYSHPSARKAVTEKQQEIESAVPSTTTPAIKECCGNWQYNSFKNGYLLWFKVTDSLAV